MVYNMLSNLQIKNGPITVGDEFETSACVIVKEPGK